MRQVIDESLRLYPTVPVNYRIATSTVTLPSGYGILLIPYHNFGLVFTIKIS